MAHRVYLYLTGEDRYVFESAKSRATVTALVYIKGSSVVRLSGVLLDREDLAPPHRGFSHIVNVDKLPKHIWKALKEASRENTQH